MSMGSAAETLKTKRGKHLVPASQSENHTSGGDCFSSCHHPPGGADAGSETGLMKSTTRKPFDVGLNKSPVTSPPFIHNVRLSVIADGTPIYAPVTTATSPSYQAPSAAGGGGVEGSTRRAGESTHGINVNMSMGSATETLKKRGRHLVPMSQSVNHTSGGDGFSGSKKARGRTPGSKKQQQLEALGSVEVGFTPHVITVKAGEDVSSKIMSFSQHSPWAICVLSANGTISNVTLRQLGTSGETVTYEGRFQILSLCGSFLPFYDGGQRSRAGGLSVSIRGLDGRVIGGGVAGLLTAASTVEIVVASFKSDGYKVSKLAKQSEPVSPALGTSGPSSLPSGGTSSESSGGW
uniref:AT-hook motif nuclear-localized protein n=1 Tax=Manihot esculenta TaxID=3983 RepID=A0A2C9TZF1_MANES